MKLCAGVLVFVCFAFCWSVDAARFSRNQLPMGDPKSISKKFPQTPRSSANGELTGMFGKRFGVYWGSHAEGLIPDPDKELSYIPDKEFLSFDQYYSKTLPETRRIYAVIAQKDITLADVHNGVETHRKDLEKDARDLALQAKQIIEKKFGRAMQEKSGTQWWMEFNGTTGTRQIINLYYEKKNLWCVRIEAYDMTLAGELKKEKLNVEKARKASMGKAALDAL